MLHLPLPRRSAGFPVSILILVVCLSIGASAQNSDPKFLSAPDFILPADAVAAGIDGVFKIALSIDESGSVMSVQFYGDPIWPCDTSPKRELAALRTVVESHLRMIKFSPLMKDGKPQKSDVILDFAIGEAFRRAVDQENAKSNPSPKLVKGGVLNGRATRLVKPFAPPTRGIAEVQILIDEQGNVVKAGAKAGNPRLFTSVRDAACSSKFSPTLLSGTPVKVTGVITYVIQ